MCLYFTVRNLSTESLPEFNSRTVIVVDKRKGYTSTFTLAIHMSGYPLLLKNHKKTMITQQSPRKPTHLLDQ